MKQRQEINELEINFYKESKYYRMDIAVQCREDVLGTKSSTNRKEVN